MAAENLETAAKKLGVEIKVETQGSIGVENALTSAEIAAADGVIIAASTTVNKDRFSGKKLLDVDVTEAVDHPEELFERVKTAPVYQENKDSSNDASANSTEPKATNNVGNKAKGIYGHLMTGVSYMIPFVVAGGICTALAFAVGGINAHGVLAQAISSRIYSFSHEKVDQITKFFFWFNANFNYSFDLNFVCGFSNEVYYWYSNYRFK